MASRNECERSRARLQRETPGSDDASLLVLQEQAAEYIRESKRRDASEPDELIASVIDAVARGYFQHVLGKNYGEVVLEGAPSRASPGTSSPVLAGFDDALRIRRNARSAAEFKATAAPSPPAPRWLDANEHHLGLALRTGRGAQLQRME